VLVLVQSTKIPECRRNHSHSDEKSPFVRQRVLVVVIVTDWLYYASNNY